MEVKNFLDELDDLTVPELPVVTVEGSPPSMQLFNNIERKAIELMITTGDLDTVALRMAMPRSAIEAILMRQDVQEHIKLLSESMNQMETMRLKALCTRMLDEKIALADETDSNLTKKDALEILKVYNEILSAERKAKEPSKQDNIFVSILQQVMEK